MTKNSPLIINFTIQFDFFVCLRNKEKNEENFNIIFHLKQINKQVFIKKGIRTNIDMG